MCNKQIHTHTHTYIHQGADYIKKGVRGGRLVFTGSRASGSERASSSSGSDRGSAGLRTPSPADELHRSLVLAKNIPGSPGHKATGKPKRPGASISRNSSAGSLRSAGDVGDVDIMFRNGGGRSGATEGIRGALEWTDETGIRIDDILEDAKKAANSPKRDLGGAGAMVVSRTAAASRSPSVAPSADSSRLSVGTAHTRATAGVHVQGAGGSVASVSLAANRRPGSDYPGVDRPGVDRPGIGRPGADQLVSAASSDSASVSSLSLASNRRPAIAPLMAARLGLTIGGASPTPGGSVSSGMRVPPAAPVSNTRDPLPIGLSR
jgi:hypothetical protein